MKVFIGRKLPVEYENPIDNLIYKVVEFIDPIFHMFGITPNTITFMSMLFCLMSAYCFMIDFKIFACILFIISYIFDSLDGYTARKYKKVTVFGDIIDHVSDTLGGAVFLFLFFKKSQYIKITILTVLIILSFFHLSCQELFYNKKHESKTLNAVNICSNSKYMKYTRYFGTGTTSFMFALFILI